MWRGFNGRRARAAAPRNPAPAPPGQRVEPDVVEVVEIPDGPDSPDSGSGSGCKYSFILWLALLCFTCVVRCFHLRPGISYVLEWLTFCLQLALTEAYNQRDKITRHSIYLFLSLNTRYFFIRYLIQYLTEPYNYAVIQAVFLLIKTIISPMFTVPLKLPGLPSIDIQNFPYVTHSPRPHYIYIYVNEGLLFNLLQSYFTATPILYLGLFGGE